MQCQTNIVLLNGAIHMWIIYLIIAFSGIILRSSRSRRRMRFICKFTLLQQCLWGILHIPSYVILTLHPLCMRPWARLRLRCSAISIYPIMESNIKTTRYTPIEGIKWSVCLNWASASAPFVKIVYVYLYVAENKFHVDHYKGQRKGQLIVFLTTRKCTSIASLPLLLFSTK